MSDGRAFTSYVSSCQMNAEIQSKNGIQDDTQYRQFLQKNSEKIMKQEQQKGLKK